MSQYHLADSNYLSDHKKNKAKKISPCLPDIKAHVHSSTSHFKNKPIVFINKKTNFTPRSKWCRAHEQCDSLQYVYVCACVMKSENKEVLSSSFF